MASLPSIDFSPDSSDQRGDLRDFEKDKLKQMFDLLANDFRDGAVCVINRDLTLLYAAGQEMNDPALLEKNLHQPLQEDLHPAINHQTLQHLKRAFDGNPVLYEVMNEGTAFSVSTLPVLNSSGSISELIVIIRNVTDRLRLNNNLTKAREKEKEFNILRSRFVTLASHEFRTPLSTILTSVFLLENYAGEDYEQEKKSYIDKIKRAVRNITDLLNDFLAIGKLEEGKLKADFSEIETVPFFESILEEIVSIKNVKQKILFTCNCPVPTISTDKQLLKNIVMNLLTNAVKYSSREEEIELAVELKNDSLKIKVTDKGIGIPENEQSHIFKRFYRGQNANNIEGAGLGLNLAKKYVRLLKGTIEFASELNKGTTFVVVIPVNKPIEKRPG